MHLQNQYIESFTNILNESWKFHNETLGSNLSISKNDRKSICLTFKIYSLYFSRKFCDHWSSFKNKLQTFINWSHIPPIGVKNGEDGTNFTGIIVLLLMLILYDEIILTTHNFDCIKPNLSPTHPLGPSPNGMNANGCLDLTFSSENLSGSNFSGSG